MLFSKLVKRNILTASIVLVGFVQAFCQSRLGSISRDITVTVDNDIYFHTDYYYTAGAKINYRRLIYKDSKLYKLMNSKQSNSARLFIDYHCGSKIFNPRNISFKDSKTTDRPYAGYNYAGLNLIHFKSPTKGIDLGFELGVIGEITGLGEFQRWLHRQTHFLVPKGWDSQISNEMVVNLNFQILRSVKVARGVDLISNTGLYAGTGLNRISQDATFRFLRFNPISNSNFLKTNLNWEKPATKLNNEFFLFAGLGIDYTVSNIFIEGSLFSSNRSPFTVAAEPLIFRTNAGMMYSRSRSSLSMTVHHLSKEVAKGTSHTYVALAFGYRF